MRVFSLFLCLLFLGCQQGKLPSFTPPKNEGKILLISRGGKVDLEKYLVPGKYTLFEFYADW